MTKYGGASGSGSVTMMTCPPDCYSRPRELTPNVRRWMLAKGWIDHRVVQRIERPDSAHVALLDRLIGQPTR